MAERKQWKTSPWVKLRTPAQLMAAEEKKPRLVERFAKVPHLGFAELELRLLALTADRRSLDTGRRPR